MPVILVILAVSWYFECLLTSGVLVAAIVAAGAWLELRKRSSFDEVLIDAQRIGVEFGYFVAAILVAYRYFAMQINFCVANVIRALLFLPLVDYREWENADGEVD